MKLQNASVFQFLVGQIIRLKGIYSAALTAWTGVYALPLVIGSATAALIKKANHQPFDAGVWRLLCIIFVIMAFRSLALLLGIKLTFKLIFKTSAWLKIKVLDQLLQDPSNRILAGSSEILNRLRNDTEELGGLLEWTTDLVYRSVLSMIAITVLVSTDLVMTIPVILLLGGFFISVFLKNRVKSLQAETRKKQGKLSVLIADTLSGIRDLRLTGALENRILALEKHFAERRQILIRQQAFADLLSDLFRNLVLIGTSAVLVTMSFRQTSGGFDVSKLVLFLTYSSWLGQQMYFFGKIFALYQNGKVSYSRLHELFESKRPRPTALQNGGDSLRELVVDKLTFLAPSGALGSTPISFRVRPGEIAVITGATGAGKSRMLQSLLGLNSSVIGSVYWNERDITGNSEWMRAPRVGYAGQLSKFFRGSLLENIVLGYSDLSMKAIELAMKAAQFNSGSIELADGLSTQLDSGNASQLSGGQRQRLALVRMLVRPADLYLVDDCDSSLDNLTARSLWGEVRTIRQTAAWIIVSRNEDLLKQADHLIAL